MSAFKVEQMTFFMLNQDFIQEMKKSKSMQKSIESAKEVPSSTTAGEVIEAEI